MLDKFVNKSDFIVTCMALILSAINTFIFMPSVSKDPAKSSISFSFFITLLCFYRLVKHVLSYIVKLNLALRIFLVLIIHSSLFLFYGKCLNLYGSILVGKLIFGIVLSVGVIIFIEILLTKFEDESFP